MYEFIEGSVLAFMLVILLAIGFFGYNDVTETNTYKAELFNECLILSEHDKFECYSMIYGDK